MKFRVRPLRPKRGHILAIATAAFLLSPVIAAADTANTTISTTISAVISVFTTNGTVNANVLPTVSGAQTTASDTVTISTNDTAGYTLKLEDANATTNLTSGGNNITATTGTQASPIALTAGKWGYRVDGVGGFGAGPTSPGSNTAIGSVTYAGVPASGAPNTLKTTATTATNDTTTVWYSVAADTAQAIGTYTDVVTYTALTN
ncbi:MAG: exported protein of unknown function [Patescibacteria group bacterium]|nr:exported protein of unknown function [Patescibacteria group bacterium]